MPLRNMLEPRRDLPGLASLEKELQQRSAERRAAALRRSGGRRRQRRTAPSGKKLGSGNSYGCQLVGWAVVFGFFTGLFIYFGLIGLFGTVT
jgi:hypothetical protein